MIQRGLNIVGRAFDLEYYAQIVIEGSSHNINSALDHIWEHVRQNEPGLSLNVFSYYLMARQRLGERSSASINPRRLVVDGILRSACGTLNRIFVVELDFEQSHPPRCFLIRSFYLTCFETVDTLKSSPSSCSWTFTLMHNRVTSTLATRPDGPRLNVH